jgi:hypothetical protein
MTIPASGPVTFTDIQTEFGGTNPIALNEYYAGGGLVPAGTTGTYGAVPSSGQISVQNFYGTTAYTPIYVDEVFSAYLYAGTGATQTVTNGIDLSTKGGLVWVKGRSGAWENKLTDTVRGATKALISNTEDPQSTDTGGVTSFSTTGFVLGADGNYNYPGGGTYVSWTFREQPKFFDIVTWTGTGANPQVIPHNLGSVPGCIMVKVYNDTDGWIVYHRSLANTQWLGLNTTAAVANGSTGPWGATTPTSTQFTVGSYANGVGLTYVAYIFAHNAGGFGATGSDNIITCGSFTATNVAGNASGVVTDLGYEPQLVLIKKTSAGVENWFTYDTARGFSMAQNYALFPNASSSENNTAGGDSQFPSANGFQLNLSGAVGSTYIYIAIRKGGMKVPTVGTSVFTPLVISSGNVRGTTTFPIDMQIFGVTASSSSTLNWSVYDRIRSLSTTTINDQYGRLLLTTSANPENSSAPAGYNTQYNNTGYYNQTGSTWSLNFVRATNFLDTICYNGNSAYGATQTHRLGIAPEMMWFKSRSSTTDWIVWHKALSISQYLLLDDGGGLQTGGAGGTEYFNNTLPTSSVVTLGAGIQINMTGRTYVGYVFGTVAGVSKVGSYTGTGAAQTIDCGFTTGARYVMIKRTTASTTGNWYVFDTARGFTSGNDPWILLDQTQAQTTGNNYVDPQSTGFTINASAPNGINASGALFIFWAIA